MRGMLLLLVRNDDAAKFNRYPLNLLYFVTLIKNVYTKIFGIYLPVSVFVSFVCLFFQCVLCFLVMIVRGVGG